jgi:hypothetical protein
MREVDHAVTKGASDMRSRLLFVAQKAIKHRRKAETDGAARIAYDFCANEYIDALLAELLPAGSLNPLKEI